MKKLIVTNWGALKARYKAAGVARVKKALDELVSADAARGITTSVAGLDDASVPASKRAAPRPPTSVDDAKRAKAAIDALYAKAKKPDYLMILGGPDVVPHVMLENPVADGSDPDANVPSDLPYACDEPWSTRIRSFVGPDRALGRLPDLPGETKPEALIASIRAAAAHVPSPKVPTDVFALSAKVWKDATAANLRRVFGVARPMHVAPPVAPPWKKTQLAPLLHFVNCHGAEMDFQFYGDDGDAQDPSIRVQDIASRVPRGAIVAAECCYGAELFDAAVTPHGMCITYLREGAVGFLGSTNVAYGASQSPVSEADIVCAEFARLARQGASLGRALLEARLEFVKKSSPLNPFELKTLGQFLLLGDPSLRAVAAPGSTPKSTSSAKTAARPLSAKPTSGKADLAALPVAERVAKLVAPPSPAAVARHTRHRRVLVQDARRLRQTTESMHMKSEPSGPSETVKRVREAASAHGFVAGAVHECAPEPRSAAGSRAKSAPGSARPGESFFVAFGRCEARDEESGEKRAKKGDARNVAARTSSPSSAKSSGRPAPSPRRVVRIEALVARVLDGRVVKARRVVSR